jgi:protein involved in polysaccharide export with SLBB domain
MNRRLEAAMTRKAGLEALSFESNRHREERSDAAIQGAVRRPTTPGWLRLASNDDRGSTQTQFALALLCAGALVLGATMAPQARAGGSVLTPSDVVTIKIIDQPELNATTRIAPDGTINFPYVGRIKAAGLTEDELARAIEKRLIERQILAHP